MRLTGYLASFFNVPPLIFRFQYNPELLSERKSFKYSPVNSFGKWWIDQTLGAPGVLAAIPAFFKDLKDLGPLLTNTRPLEPDEGEQRTFAIDFHLDALNPGPMDGDSHYDGSIEPDLAVLRSFMNPSIDVFDLGKSIINWDWPCWNRPPECSLIYAGLSVNCVMTDLNIKVTAFKDDRTPQRAEVTVTLKEQTYALAPIAEVITRYINVGISYTGANRDRDWVAVTPVLNLFEGKIFE